MTKHDIEYKGEKVGLIKLRQIKKSEGVKSASLKKDYGFSAKQIKEFEESGKLNFTIYGKTKYYSREDILKLL